MKKVLVVDIDGTLTMGEYPYDKCTPNQKVIDKVNEYYDKGWIIKLLTARGQNSFFGDVEKCNLVYRGLTENWLEEYGVKYHSLSFQKPAAIHYIDDKAIRPNEFYTIKDLENKKVVFTNGCFDLLGYHHIKFLEECKKLGDYLIVGLNSDESVKKLKGENRPILNENIRKEMLESLKSVDRVVIFNEESPVRLIKELSVDILCKGGDYLGCSIDGSKEVRDRGGEVLILKEVIHPSTTDLIQKIKRLNV